MIDLNMKENNRRNPGINGNEGKLIAEQFRLGQLLAIHERLAPVGTNIQRIIYRHQSALDISSHRAALTFCLNVQRLALDLSSDVDNGNEITTSLTLPEQYQGILEELLLELTEADMQNLSAELAESTLTVTINLDATSSQQEQYPEE